MSALLEVRDLELAYGHVVVCRDISLRLDSGEIVALIGANGAGKIHDPSCDRGCVAAERGAILYFPARRYDDALV